MFTRNTCALLLLYTLLITACRSSRGLDQSWLSNQVNYCAPAVNYSYVSNPLPVRSVDSLRQFDSTLGALLSRHDALLANAAGVLPLLRELLAAKKHSAIDAKFRALELRQKISHRLRLVASEVSAVSAELDCEGERADQGAGYLDNLNDRRNRRLTVASIVLGSMTTAATVLLDNNGVQNAVGFGGGVFSAILGGLTAFPSGKRLRLEHPRNVLADIWSPSEQSLVYPPFVWYVLNEKSFSNNGGESLLNNIKRRWLTFEFEDDPDPALEELLFRSGGMYSAEDLHTRANMINQLQSTVRSINQDLQSLLLTLDDEL